MDDRQAVGYVRVSTEEQSREGVSLDAQEARLRAYCELQGLTLVALVRDAAVSAGIPLARRPGGVQIVDLVESGQIRHVIALKLDRLFRDAVDCLNTSRHWDAAGVALHLLDMGGQTMNTASALGRFFLTVVAGAAEMERNLVRERTRVALQHKKSRGDRLGATPLGLVTPEPGAAMVANTQELHAVALILRQRRAGRTFRKIAALLERRGLPTKRGGRWDPATVRKVWLRRENYRHLLAHDKRRTGASARAGAEG